jgi:D-3-phosphoglycerate dehydrogenase
MGLTGRTLGVIGAGRIGKELLRMARVFDMKLLAADPYVNSIELPISARARSSSTSSSKRRTSSSSAACSTKARGILVGAREFAKMRRSAYFVNVARGPIVDEPALIAALRDGRIAGAALDVFEQEPIAPDNPLIGMDNVILTPHSLCWTDECFHNMASTGLKSIVDALSAASRNSWSTRKCSRTPKCAPADNTVTDPFLRSTACPLVADARLVSDRVVCRR